jgi:hypothetical protein
VRVPDHITDLAPPGSESLGPVVMVLCEFQMIDAETDAANEVGEASHEAYKERQRRAVYNRLRLGARTALPADDSLSPPPPSVMRIAMEVPKSGSDDS